MLTDNMQAVNRTALLTRVNLTLWRRWVFVKLHAMIRISFIIKWQWVLEPFSRYRCWKILNWLVTTNRRRLSRLALVYQLCTWAKARIHERFSGMHLDVGWWGVKRSYIHVCEHRNSFIANNFLYNNCAENDLQWKELRNGNSLPDDLRGIQSASSQ